MNLTLISKKKTEDKMARINNSLKNTILINLKELLSTKAHQTADTIIA